jgi:outer membrane lipoprotein carrier protein
MKYSIVVTICLLFTFNQLVIGQPNQKKAEEILEAISKKYKSFTSYKAKFTYTIENVNSNVKEQLNGEITVKGEKFKLDLSGQEIINNGTTVWTYLKEENEVTISKNENNLDVITPSTIHLEYKKGYSYQFIEEIKEGKSVLEVIELVPQKKGSATTKIKLFANKKDKTIKRWILFERNGTQYNYTITQFTPNTTLADSFFSFDKAAHKGVEVVDLQD